MDVLEAEFSKNSWVPLTGGLGGGQALFITMDFSMSVSAPREEMEEEVQPENDGLKVMRDSFV